MPDSKGSINSSKLLDTGPEKNPEENEQKLNVLEIKQEKNEKTDKEATVTATTSNKNNPSLIQTRNSLVGKLLGGEYQVPVSKLYVFKDHSSISMLLDTASFLIGIVATRASIIGDSIAQHAPLNQRPGWVGSL
ncbi:hypothetical protein BB558_006911 [Smittium angustum]|uniref:Uncharacterized protein n=1 Tax=Smittium angustum TaxID=133377 RepID=A0A2U1IWH7_SMIAN|nr:hypothetical protein BB558_006911 [Smittium angustum]